MGGLVAVIRLDSRGSTNRIQSVDAQGQGYRHVIPPENLS
jgi:hypothetical protein